MFGLFIIFGQLWGEPWYGKNTGLMEGLPTGLCYIELTGCHLLSTRAGSGTAAPPCRDPRGQ